MNEKKKYVHHRVDHHVDHGWRLSLPPVILLALFASTAPSLHAQLSLTSTVDLALRNNPRVKMGEAELAKAKAALSEARDVYVPSIAAGAGLGQSYGYSPNPPTLFTFNAQSLVYNASQFAYVRSARAGILAASLSLADTREAVAEDVALTFIALDHDQRREEVLRDEAAYAGKLVNIVQERFDAGRDRRIDLTTARLAEAQLRLARMRAEDETANDRGHLARLLSLPPRGLRAEGGFPAQPILTQPLPSSNNLPSPAVAAAFASAKAKQQLAFGDARQLYRPQISLAIQYNRYATFTSSFKQIQSLYSINNAGSTIGANAGFFGVQITVPLYDKIRLDKNRESMAEAVRSFHEAETAQAASLDGESKLAHTIEELRARVEVAALDQQLAQQQLEAVLTQINAGVTGQGAPLTPKDEQNSRLAEREKFLATIDTNFQLQQAEISFLRQTGRLADWLKGASNSIVQAPHP